MVSRVKSISSICIVFVDVVCDSISSFVLVGGMEGGMALLILKTHN